jgi:carboxyl-terminal processing protease
MKNFVSKNKWGTAVVAVFILASFFVGFHVGAQAPNPIDQVTDVSNKISTSTPTGNADFSLFWKTWNLLDEKYVATHASTTDSAQQRLYGAIKGMVESLGDPYTVFFPPEDAAIFKSEIAGNFEGIGLEVGVKDDMIVAVSPLKGSPAEKAGILPGDIIVSVNGESTEGRSVDQVVKTIRGKKGTKVTLTLIRDPKKPPFDAVMVRDTISVPTVDTEARKDGIFIIKLYSFSETSPDLFRSALQQFVVSGDHKLILDLRGNPGGYLDAAVDMASWFLPQGSVVVQEDYGSGKKGDTYESKGYNIFNKNLQMIILTDGGSASASEILAGALHEHGIAKLVGTKTFGKGSVQELIPISSDTSLKVTVARWLTPNGLSISDHGIVPDVEVNLTPDDVKNRNDLQTKKAIEMLTKLP